mgnify:CR=1 FL=1
MNTVNIRMKSSEERLQRIRQRIDAIDSEFLKLLTDRAKLAAEVADIKAAQKNPVYYRPEREAQILRSIVERNQSLLPDREVARIFRSIMTACLNLQKPLEIAFLGPEGTFSQQAAAKHFGEGAKLSPRASIPEIFRAVSTGQVHYGVVPIENSSEGMINQTLDQLISSDVNICGEINLRIQQHLVTREDNQKITCIYSHQQSLAQCREWLLAHYPQTPTREVSSNALAARKAAEDPEIAAVCGSLAAQQYGLIIRNHAIEDYPNNTTRFIIIGKQIPAPSGKDKTSLIISSPHTAGSLSKILLPFDKHHLNMTLIESRPYRHRNWTYIFFIDFEGHQADPNVRMALDELSEASVMMTFLGSYPQATG